MPDGSEGGEDGLFLKSAVVFTLTELHFFFFFKEVLKDVKVLSCFLGF